MLKKILAYILLIPLVLFTASCGSRHRAAPPEKASRSKVSVSKAQRFTLELTDSCTILRIIDPWQGASNIEQVYYLVKHSQNHLRLSDTSRLIHVPVRRIICTSTTHIAMISALGQAGSIAGISGTQYVYNRELTSAVMSGRVPDIGYDAGINNELIMHINPDLYVMYGVGAEGEGYTGKLREAGIRIMFDADYLEDDPLGKAEWIKVFGALFCKESSADSIFKEISESYNGLRDYISEHISSKPVVILGLPFRDKWYISPGNSYISRLIEDAGGNYLWHDRKSTVSIPCSLEEVYLQSRQAEFWLNTGTVSKRNEIAGFDPRLADFPPYISGNIYNNNRRTSPGGGNDYWESGTLNPQIILKDIASILHPSLFPDYVQYYYIKVK